MSELELEDILDNGTNPYVPEGKIPGGLMALCILTLVGSGLILLKDLFTYQMYSMAQDFVQTTSNITNQPVVNPFANIGWVYLLEVLSCLAAAAGGILMMLKFKAGFPIWIAATALYIAETIWFYFFMMNTELSEWSVLGMIILLGGPIAFIPLYANYRKYLTK